MCLLDIFRILQSIHNSAENTSVVINWYYDEDDEDMSDVIDAFQESNLVLNKYYFKFQHIFFFLATLSCK